MRVVWLREFGEPGVLAPGEAPNPRPGAGQVLLDVAAIGVLFVETQIRSGNSPVPLPTLPVVPGNGVAGTVVEVGRDADPALAGQRFVTATGGSGGYAERIAVDADGLIPVPEELGLPEAVALLADGCTALAVTRATSPKEGEWVLVEAAAGGVGTLLVQLAVNAGAKVIAAASSAAKLRLAEELGAHATVDYSTPGWGEQVRAIVGGAGVQVVLDGVGGTVGRTAFELTAPGSRFAIFGAASGSFTPATIAEVFERRITLITGRQLFTSPADVRLLTVEALAQAAKGLIRPVIGRTFPLERAADAHAAVEGRAVLGKTLLLP
ncbi:zinc-binding dehydrogenase [Streptosporangium sp. NPDC051022]|uniref:zinc-binding dehydrogenase n=1 Tax=Streptosporangium sp. NPDC051022 TaxID=3155752 RepID=UPI0034168F74